MTRISPNKLRRHLQRLQESLPVALVKRFVEADLMTQAASLSFYTLLSLAPLLVLLLWLTASLYPPAQQSLVDQIGALAGEQAAVVAETIIRNADSQPDVGSLAGLASTGLHARKRIRGGCMPRGDRRYWRLPAQPRRGRCRPPHFLRYGYA